MVAKGLSQFIEAMSHDLQGHPRHMSHNEEVRQNMFHWRRIQQPTCCENPMNIMKRQNYVTLEDDPPLVRRYLICYSEEQSDY